MSIFIGFVIIFMPFLPLIMVAKYGTKMLELEDEIVLPSTISFANPIKMNYDILKVYLLEELSFVEKEANKICSDFKKFQLYIFLYLIVGAIQLFSIITYSVSVLSNINLKELYTENANIFGAYIAIPIMAFVTFWIFYGNELFHYIGLDKASRIINQTISVFLKLIESLQKKCTMFILSFLYFFVLLMYLYYLSPIASQISTISNGFPLVGICVLIFAFYFGMPKIFSITYGKVFSKFQNKVDKKIVYKSLKNTTYLHLLIIFVYGTLLQQNNSLLLQGITVLFLYDTYLQNKKEIEKE